MGQGERKRDRRSMRNRRENRDIIRHDAEREKRGVETRRTRSDKVKR